MKARRTGQKRGIRLLPWEVVTGVAAESQPGLLPAQSSLPLTLVLFLVISIWLYPVMGGTALLVGLLFGRLMALDLTTYTLPNIYTLPLLAVGWGYAFTHGQGVNAVVAGVVLLAIGWLAGKLPGHMGLGGGDLKLLAAIFAFLPSFAGFTALAVGCLLWLPVAFAAPRRPVPFGVPVLLGWLVVMRVGEFAWLGLPKWLFAPIS